MRRSMTLCLFVIVFAAAPLFAADWMQFRGPGGLANSDETGLPTSWSADENIAWRKELPGAGGSSPITLGDRIYLTCYSGYAESIEEPGEMSDLMRHVVCLDLKSGETVWSVDVAPELPESEYRPGNDSRHGYATSTPVTDGERLYVFFGKTGVICYSLDGKELWRTSVGTDMHHWGSGASPVIYENLLIVNASVESKSLVALNKKTGDEVWRTPIGKGVWNTPALVRTAEGGVEMVLSTPQRVKAFDPATGEELWNCDGIPDRGYICPSVISHDGIVYVIGGRQNTAIAIRTGGRGDVTETHELWRTSKGSNVASPVYYKGHIYWIHEGKGIAYCLNAENGEVVYEERLSPRPGLVYASVLAADGKLYAVSQEKGVYVLAAQPEFEQLAHNAIEGDDARANACPVATGGRLLIRNDRYLYCIGKPAAVKAGG